MHTWSTDSFVNAFDTLPPPGNPWNQEDIYATPTMKRDIPNFVPNYTPTLCRTEVE